MQIVERCKLRQQRQIMQLPGPLRISKPGLPGGEKIFAAAEFTIQQDEVFPSLPMRRVKTQRDNWIRVCHGSAANAF
jgi:hypothetical protein